MGLDLFSVTNLNSMIDSCKSLEHPDTDLNVTQIRKIKRFALCTNMNIRINILNASTSAAGGDCLYLRKAWTDITD